MRGTGFQAGSGVLFPPKLTLGLVTYVWVKGEGIFHM